MVDQGNATTIGHRRWTLSNSLGPIGLGSTGTGASCFQNLRGTGRAGKPWMAWPSPGIIPLQAFGSGRGGTIDATGWTVQSDDINLAGAAVTVTSGGTNMPVTVTQLQGGYGSRYAFRFTPNGLDHHRWPDVRRERDGHSDADQLRSQRRQLRASKLVRRSDFARGLGEPRARKEMGSDGQRDLAAFVSHAPKLGEQRAQPVVGGAVERALAFHESARTHARQVT